MCPIIQNNLKYAFNLFLVLNYINCWFWKNGVGFICIILSLIFFHKKSFPVYRTILLLHTLSHRYLFPQQSLFSLELILSRIQKSPHSRACLLPTLHSALNLEFSVIICRFLVWAALRLIVFRMSRMVWTVGQQAALEVECTPSYFHYAYIMLPYLSSIIQLFWLQCYMVETITPFRNITVICKSLWLQGYSIRIRGKQVQCVRVEFTQKHRTKVIGSSN